MRFVTTTKYCCCIVLVGNANSILQAGAALTVLLAVNLKTSSLPLLKSLS